MALLDDILKWTEQDLTLWQRDAARRLFQQETGLSENDYNELYGLLKAAHGLPNPDGLAPVPLASSHLPQTPTPGKGVILKAMRDLKHVNRIGQGQTLPFAPAGLSVIYGENGSGKSGYSRVLKRACRARDQAEQVHPDAHDANAASRIPEAYFDIELGATPSSLKWTAGGALPDELATIAVFDAHCARAYVTAEQDVAFLPYGLDVVENLGNKVLPELTRRLTAEKAAINVDAQPFAHLAGDTKVGLLVSGLSDQTDPNRVRVLGTLSAQETARIAELEAALSVPDPAIKAKELRLSATRFKEQAARIQTVAAWTSEEAVTKLKVLDEAAVSANTAESIAAEALRSGDTLLSGTGNPIWKALFEAARKFSTEEAYPTCNFPHTEKGAVCPLCQESLTENAAGRLQRFETYLKEDVAKHAAQQKQAAGAAKGKIELASFSIGMDRAITAEIDALDKAVIPVVHSFEANMTDRRAAMLAALESHAWDSIPALVENPRKRIRKLAANQLRAARTFDRAADPVKINALKKEKAELDARQKLAASLTPMLELVQRMKDKKALGSCEIDLKTLPFSNKAKEFANSAVTASLKAALDAEFKALGIGHIKTKLKGRNEKGKTKYRLVLDLPTSTKLEEILSEGEQRAIALGSFLAELELANHTGGIVFDDPVSSLDHTRRRAVAKRLVEEARKRQVIVFTHDTTFLGQLRDEIEKSGVAHTIQFLEWNGPNCGHVNDGLPWGHQSYKERIDTAEKGQKRLEKKPWPAYPNAAECAEMRKEYDHLRATIERVIQDVVFAGVIRRYRDWIKIDGLQDVASLEKAECDALCALYQRCNEVVDAHDPASDKNEPVPTAGELRQDIDVLKAQVQAIQDKRKKPTANP